jgi:hypothetical protein
MTFQGPFVEPPRFAAWLVELFVSDKRAEAIAGDLVEEFSELASKSGVTSARSWYRRQSAKAIAHLIGTGFRVAPWSTVGAVVGGFLLLRFGLLLPGRAIGAVLELRSHHVVPYYTEPQMKTYLFWFNNGVLIGRLLVSLLVGCIVATVVKGREMVATTTLCLVFVVPAGVMVSMRLAENWSWYVLWYGYGLFLACIVMTFIGGAIVRLLRSVFSRRVAV